MIVSGWLLKAPIALRFGPAIAAAARERLVRDGERDPEVFDALRELEVTADRLREISARMAPVVPTSSASGSDEFIGATMSVNEVATALGVSESYITRLCRTGRLRARQRDDRTWQIDAASVDEIKERRAA